MPPKRLPAMTRDELLELLNRSLPPRPPRPPTPPNAKTTSYATMEDLWSSFDADLRDYKPSKIVSTATRKPEPIYPETWDQLSLSDQDIVNLVKTHPAWEAQMFRRIHLLCPDAAVKSGNLHESEFLASELARTSTNIPIPRIHRFVRPQSEEGLGYMVMQWIPGRPLDQCWGELSIWRKLKVLWTLRGYVQQLRTIQNPVPGRVGPVESSERTESSERSWVGVTFGEWGAGPFRSYKDMVDWLNEMLEIAKHYNRAPSSSPPFDTSHPIVFTHYDLQRRNLVLDEKNQLWMIDFGQAGFYPEPFEYVATYNSWWKDKGRQWITYLRATVIASVVAGFYRSYYDTMHCNIEWAVDTGRDWWEIRHET